MATLTTSYQLLDEAKVLSDSYGTLYVAIYAKRGAVNYTKGTCVVYYKAQTRYTSTYIRDASGSLSVSGSKATSKSKAATYITGSSPISVETSATVTYTTSGTYSGTATAKLSMPNWGNSATASATFTLPTIAAPSAPTSCSNARNSDTKNTVSWSRGSNAATIYTGQYVERRIDGGSWAQIATVAATATSYADSTTSANHYYAYRVRARGFRGYSAYSTSGTTYNTPAAPTSITAARTGETGVKLTLVNPAKTATALEVQRSTDGESWATVATVSGNAITEVIDNPGGGIFYYRARNTRSSLVSAWTQAESPVTTIAPPMAPTVLTPQSGAVYTAGSVIDISWLHNPVDGSEQTAAQVEITWSGGTETIDVSGSSKSYLADRDWALNSTVSVRVRTKGVHVDFGAWSGSVSVNVMQVPSVSFDAPNPDFIIEETPINVELQYSDPSGTLADVEIAVYGENGDEVYRRDLGTELSYRIYPDEWLPNNNTSYVFTAFARSSSTLIGSSVIEVSVAFEPPTPATLDVQPDAETGYVSLLVGIEPRISEASGNPVVVEGAQEGADIESMAFDGAYEQGADPAPDNPQPITTISGSVTVDVLGKNLCPGIEQGGYQAADGSEFGGADYVRTPKIRITAGETYVFSTPGRANRRIFGLSWDDDGVFLDGVNKAESGSLVYTTSSKAALVAFEVACDEPGGTITPEDVPYAQIEVGDTPTDCVPYEHLSTTIDLQGNEVCALPDGTKDRVEVDADGHAVLIRNVGKAVLSQCVSSNPTSGADVVKYMATFTATTDAAIGNWGAGLCDRFVTGTGAKIDGVIRFGANDAKIYIYTDNESFSSTETANTWLAANPVTVYYVLAQPQIIDLGTVDIIANVPNPYFTATLTANLPTSLDLSYSNGRAPAESVSVYRVTENGRVLIGSELDDGGAVIDKYAPTNTPFIYEAVSFASSGAPSVSEFPCAIRTPWWFFYWGENEIARGMWNPEGSIDATRPSVRLVHYSGRPLPVMYDSSSYMEERSVSLLLRSKDEADAFIKLVSDGGKAVYKSGDGDVMHVSVSASLSPAYVSPTYYGTVDCSMTKIDGEVL